MILSTKTTSQDLQEINKFVFHEISRATGRAQMQERKLITSRVHLHFRQPEIPPHFSPLPDHHFLHFSPLPLRLFSPSSLPFWPPCLAWQYEFLSLILIKSNQNLPLLEFVLLKSFSVSSYQP